MLVEKHQVKNLRSSRFDADKSEISRVLRRTVLLQLSVITVDLMVGLDDLRGLFQP